MKLITTRCLMPLHHLRRLVLLFPALLLAIACDSHSVDTDTVQPMDTASDTAAYPPTALSLHTEAAIDALRLLQVGSVPESMRCDNPESIPVKGADAIDVASFFDALPHLSMEAGWALDYDFDCSSNHFPTLVARPADGPACLADPVEPCVMEDWNDHLLVDGTPESYLELAILSWMGEQFYLGWHANSNDHRIVPTIASLEDAIDDALDFTADDWGNRDGLAEALETAHETDLNPSAVVEDGVVHLTFHYFTKWGGLYRHDVFWGAGPPYEHLPGGDSGMVAEYSCGIVF
jgi:hypothetical protein